MVSKAQLKKDPRTNLWKESPEQEDFLHDVGVRATQWSVEWFMLKDLQVKASRGNNARLTATIHDELVESLALALEDNRALPAIIVDETGYILDGNNRVAAVEHFDDPAFPVMAYVVKGLTDIQKDTIVRTANRRHGQRIVESEQLAQAANHYRTFVEGKKSGKSISAVAKEHGVSLAKLNNAILWERIRDDLLKNKIDLVRVSQISHGTLTEINKAPKKLQVPLGTFVAVKRVPYDRVRMIVRDIRSERTIARQRAVLERAVSGDSSEPCTEPKRKKRKAFRRLLIGETGLLEFLRRLQDATWEEVEIFENQEKKELKKAIVEVRRELQKIARSK